MGPKTRELVETLKILLVVLETGSDKHLSHWIKDALVRIANDDYSGIEKLLSAYGGMGSINDLVLGQQFFNGEFSWGSEHVDLNERFSTLSKKAWELAHDIKRENA